VDVSVAVSVAFLQRYVSGNLCMWVASLTAAALDVCDGAWDAVAEALVVEGGSDSSSWPSIDPPLQPSPGAAMSIA